MYQTAPWTLANRLRAPPLVRFVECRFDCFPFPADVSQLTAAGHLRAAQANREFGSLLAAMCQGCHVTYVTASGALDNPSYLADDELHDTAAGHLAIGALEGGAIARAWLAARGP